MTAADDWLRYVLDPARLAAAWMAAAEDGTDAEAVVRATGAPRRQVLEALGTLVGLGLATHEGDRFTLDVRALRDGSLA